MKILEYIGLDTSGVETAYRKVSNAIARDDFRAAQVKKLASPGYARFYRARLNDADRLPFSLVRHGNEVCALMLEVIANHDYDKSRFLRGAAIDEARIPACDTADAIGEALPMRYLHPEHTAIHLLDKPISFDDSQEAVYRPLRRTDARHPEPLHHRIRLRAPAVRAPRPGAFRAGRGRRESVESRRLAEGGAQARAAGQAGAGRSDSPRHPARDAAIVVGVRSSADHRTTVQGISRASPRRQAAAATA
jgi:hypothetical protein